MPGEFRSQLLGPLVLHEVVVQHYNDGGVTISTMNFEAGGPLRTELAYDLLQFALEPLGSVTHARDRDGTRQRLFPEPIWRDE